VPGGKAGAVPPSDKWSPKTASNEDLDDILKGLDQVEEISIEDNQAAAAQSGPPGHTSKHVPVDGPPKTESAFDRLLNEEPEQVAKKPKRKPSAPKPDELFGDEFEEIG
jgi:hypothetical protein